MDDALEALRRAEAANARARPVDIGAEVVTRPASDATRTVRDFLRRLRATACSVSPNRSASATVSSGCGSSRAHQVVMGGPTSGLRLGRADLPDFDVVDAVGWRRRPTIDLMRSAEQGHEPQVTWVAEGMVEQEESEIRWVEEDRELLG